MKVERLAHYCSEAGSRYHDVKYRRWSKRLAHLLESRILHRLLDQAGHSRDILDAPCGPARFFNVLQSHAGEIHLGDISPQMLVLARDRTAGRGASYFVVDLRNTRRQNRAYEGVVSLRLTHHLYEDHVREEYLDTLSRLASRWIILTFRDAQAPRVVLRRSLRRLRGKRPLLAQTLEEISTPLMRNGFELRATSHLSRWTSGHRYALFVRNHDFEITARS